MLHRILRACPQLRSHQPAPHRRGRCLSAGPTADAVLGGRAGTAAGGDQPVCLLRREHVPARRQCCHLRGGPVCAVPHPDQPVVQHVRVQYHGAAVRVRRADHAVEQVPHPERLLQQPDSVLVCFQCGRCLLWDQFLLGVRLGSRLRHIQQHPGGRVHVRPVGGVSGGPLQGRGGLPELPRAEQPVRVQHHQGVVSDVVGYLPDPVLVCGESRVHEHPPA